MPIAPRNLDADALEAYPLYRDYDCIARLKLDCVWLFASQNSLHVNVDDDSLTRDLLKSLSSCAINYRLVLRGRTFSSRFAFRLSAMPADC